MQNRFLFCIYFGGPGGDWCGRGESKSPSTLINRGLQLYYAGFACRQLHGISVWLPSFWQEVGRKPCPYLRDCRSIDPIPAICNAGVLSFHHWAKLDHIKNQCIGVTPRLNNGAHWCWERSRRNTQALHWWLRWGQGYIWFKSAAPICWREP